MTQKKNIKKPGKKKCNMHYVRNKGVVVCCCTCKEKNANYFRRVCEYCIDYKFWETNKLVANIPPINAVEYEKQLDLFLITNNKTCYIMKRTADDCMFVTLDKELADNLYESGEYIMRISQLFNP